MQGKPISVAGIQKRIEYYARNKRIERVVSLPQTYPRDTASERRRPSCLHPGSSGTCPYHQPTQRLLPCRKPQVQRDYYKAMEVVAATDAGNWRRTSRIHEVTLVNTEPRTARFARGRGSVVRKAPRPSSLMEKKKQKLDMKSENGRERELHEKQKEQTRNWTRVIDEIIVDAYDRESESIFGPFSGTVLRMNSRLPGDAFVIGETGDGSSPSINENERRGVTATLPA